MEPYIHAQDRHVEARAVHGLREVQEDQMIPDPNELFFIFIGGTPRWEAFVKLMIARREKESWFDGGFRPEWHE